jgi:hypothetical protein
MAWIKEQYTKANGKKYGPYYYIYKTYYESGMDYPRQIKLGKVGDSPLDLASSFRSKAESKGWDISEDEIQELEETVEEAQSHAEDDEDIAEFIESETEDDKLEEDEENSEEESQEKSEDDDTSSSEKSYGGIGGGRQRKLDKIEEFDRLKTLEKSDIDSKDDIERFIEEMSVPGVASARGSHVDLDDLLDRVDKMYGDLPNDKARSAYVNDNKLFRTLRSTRRHFNKLIDKEQNFAQMPSAVEAGPAKYPTGKRDKKRKSLRKQKEKVEEKVDRLYGRLKGARQRALKSIGSSVGEQNEKKRADTREEQRERFEKGMMAEFFHGITSYGRIKRVNKKSVTFEYWRNKPREEGYELASLRIDMPSDRYTVVEGVKLTEDAVKEIDEKTYNLIRSMDDSEVPETVDADFLEKIKSEAEEDFEEEEEEPEENVVLKKENEKGEVKEYDVPESKAEDRADALIDAPHGTVEKIWIDGEVYYENSGETEEDEEFDSMQAVKKLTRKGVIVEKDAVDEIRPGDVERIESLDVTPMYLSASMLRKLRDQKGDISGSKTVDIETGDLEYANVEIISDVPEFMGMDGDVYGGYDGGEQITLPDDNAEILVNRGLAERVEEEEDSSVKNDDSSESSANQDEDDSMDKDDGKVKVEFLQKTPSFMGTDLVTYGGYEEGDTARIPEDNAEILENRGNVEVKGGIANVAEEQNQSKTDKNGPDSSFEGASENEELRDAMQEIGEFIEENGTKDDPVSYDEIYDSFSIEEDLIEKALERLSANGETYEPKKNHVLTI